MEVRNIRSIIAGLVGIGIVVLVIVLIIKAFTGGGGTPTKQIDLGKYASTNAAATFYIDAPTNLDQDHRTVKIVIDQNQTEIDIIQGYQNSVMNTQVFPNNEAAYAVFLQSLKTLNYAKGNNDPAKADERGYCPQGDRYVYQFSDGTKNLFRYWSTSCGQGTFTGNRLQVRELFQHQIPDKVFSQLTSGIPLGG